MMMESCFNSRLERPEPVDVDDVKRNLSSEFSALPDSQSSTFEETEHLQVYLRIRPFTSAESDNGESQDCVTIEHPDMVLLKPPSSSLSVRLSDKSLPQPVQRFQFSQVYGPDTTQRELFEGTVKGLVRDVLEGGNSLVFTYGVTNAGKTFTFLGPDGDAGILPRSLNVIFSSIEERVYTQMSIKPHRCREFVRLTKEQQAEEAVCKRSLLRQLKESEKSSAIQMSSTSKTILEGSTMLGTTVVAEDNVSLEVESHTKFSVWVSFCEIYNENIHDLLELVPSGALKRTALRLSQDVRGNAFVKDLRWVQVNSAEEAYRVMMLGKRNQSFSSTKLNQLSSRSHSIFSIRILRIEDVGIPRVHTISELSLCDLAGSERCAKTQNKGKRLKEAGNINTSLLILGKCINALRHNQQAKLLQHVPFRESKLTHYLQGFFCGRGKACMIVNINQCASMYDETLNVLKFSALAQKVVVLTTRNIPIMPQRSAREVSLIINNADRKALRGSRRTSLIGWESSLEDVQEDEDDEEDEEASLMEDTVQESDEDDSDDDKVAIDKGTYQRQMALLKNLQVQLKKERAETMLLEARVREEVSREFSELFSEMQNDYNDRLAREREILEERAERRLEIFKNLVGKIANTGPSQDTEATEKTLDLDGMIDSMSSDLEGIKKAAEAAHTCLGSDRLRDQAGESEAVEDLGNKVLELNEQLRKVQEQLVHKTSELEKLTGCAHQSNNDLAETKKSLKSQELKLSELMEICNEKDEMISKLQTTMDQQVEDATKDKDTLNSIREEILHLKANCTCFWSGEKEKPSNSRKRQIDTQPDLEGQPPLKKDFLGEAGGEDEKVKRKLCIQLQEKSSEVALLERREADLQKAVELASQQEKSNPHKDRLQELTVALGDAAHTREQALNDLREEQRGHQEALAALEKEKKAKEDAFAALEYQTMQKEEVLASLEEEMKAREAAMAALEEERRAKEEGMAALEEEKRAREETMAALEEEKRAKEEAVATLAEEKKYLEKFASTMEFRRLKDEAQSALHTESKELRQLSEEQARLQEDGTLQQEAQEMTGKLEDMENEVTSQKVRAQQASVSLHVSPTQMEIHNKEIQQKSPQIHTLTWDVKGLKQDLENLSASATIERERDHLKEEVCELSYHLANEKKENERKLRRIVELEHELTQAKEQTDKQLTSDHQLEELTEKLNHQELVSKQQRQELEAKLKEQEVMSQKSLDELRGKLKQQEQVSKQELQQLRTKLEEQTQTSEKQVEELRQRLKEQEATCQQQAEEFKHKLSEQQAILHQEQDHFKQKLSQQEQTSDLLTAELKEARCKVEGLRNDASKSGVVELNSDLQADIALLMAKVTKMEEDMDSPCEIDVESEVVVASELFQASSNKLASSLRDTAAAIDRLLQKKDGLMERKLAEKERMCIDKEAELQKKLADKEAQVVSLQKKLQVAQEQREEEDSQAVKEARQREVERRRELLAVAEEAIAQKDAELEKRGQEIARLKESAKQESEKIKNISLDLQRKEDDTSDLREKLADSKKQINQVQKEISAMRNEEKGLKQKLADMEKAKKQLQSDLASRDRTVHQLKTQEKTFDSKSDQTLQLYQKACKDLEAKERVMEDMRLALTEQEETQEQMERVLEEKLDLIQELTDEVEKLKTMLQKQDSGENIAHERESQSDDLRLAKLEAAQAQESLKLSTEKYQADRRKWLDEKMALIGQAKEAEDKRNQEMRKFADDRERHTRQQSQLESLLSQLAEKEQTMERWRQERDTLVAALEVQLQKLLSSNADKDKLIQQLHHTNNQLPQESCGIDGVSVAEMQAALSERDTEILQLKERLKALTTKGKETSTQTESEENPAEKPHSETIIRNSARRGDARASVSSQCSVGCPSVLDSSEISTENGRTSRFPKPELEISFSPLQPNRMALRRQGQDNPVTVKITRSARKRKSTEMEKDEMEAENRRNTKSRLTPKMTPHQEEGSSPAGGHDSHGSTRSKKEGTLQKIGDFLQSSPTLLGTKAKKMMSLVSGRCDGHAEASSSSSSSLSLTAKKSKRKLYRPQISSPMDIPSHPIISREPEEKESDHLIIKRRLRTRNAK
uniref:Kinesin family member 20Ba n=1 Tax=Myripristis murdjan TaxID=586833 RepID=A0A668ASG9_9TELE